ncbi:MAG: YwiC-like family protein [bacterium]
MKIPPPIIPKEHGAWAVLLVPLLVGASVADRFGLNVLYLALSALSGFMKLCARANDSAPFFVAPQGKEKLQAAIFWSGGCLGIATLFILPLFLQKLWMLLGIGMVGMISFFGNFILVRRYTKTILSDLISVAGLTLSASSAYYVATGDLNQTAALLWLLNFLFFGTFKLSSTVRFKNLGLILLAHSLVFALLFAIGASLIFAQAGNAQLSMPAVSTPAESKDFNSADLQKLISAAPRGDTIFVSSGVYEGNITIDKKLTLLGRDWPVIRGEGKGSVVVITADSCVFKGFVVEHCGRMLVNEDAGILIKSNGNVVEDNRLRDLLFGIYLLHANRNIVARNNIVGRKELELGERGSGIHIWNSQHNRFISNVITDSRDGFYIQNANHTYLERNEAFDLRYGVHYMYADSNVFLHNKFYNNVAGAAIMYSRGIVMRHNSFMRNRGFASFGILFQDCHNSIADSNIIADNVVGMFFEASTNNFFRHNIIAQNDVALQMFQNSERNTFAENNFIDNLNPLSLVGKRTLTHWSKNGKGNYWSAYDGYDLDYDSIGDIPMKIQNVFDYLEGQHPNLRLYLYSPVSQALAVAAKAFPIIEINQEVDEHPLMRPSDLQKITPTDEKRPTDARK